MGCFHGLSLMKRLRFESRSVPEAGDTAWTGWGDFEDSHWVVVAIIHSSECIKAWRAGIYQRRVEQSLRSPVCVTYHGQALNGLNGRHI
jgi:hypothetical protein